MTLFDGLKASIDDLVRGRAAPADRAAQLRAMKAGLVQAKLAIADLRAGADQTRARLAAEQRELATVTRRRDLAAGVRDDETVRLAEQFAVQHAERVAVLERKLTAQDDEIALAEREVAEMTASLKAAAAGVGDAPAPRPPSDADLGLPDDAPLRGELDAMQRAAQRASAEQGAEARLAELKRRMGR
jgi:phage shock protein A